MTYFEMVKSCIVNEGNKRGSTLPAIKAYVESMVEADGKEYKNHQLLAALRISLKNGRLLKDKGSYRLSHDEKEVPLSKEIEDLAAMKKKKPRAKKAKSTAKTPAAKAKATPKKKAAGRQTATSKRAAKK